MPKIPVAQAFLPVLILIPLLAHAEERVDNVLAKLIPPDSTSLLGARMDQLKSAPIYQKLISQKKLPQMDEFARDTGFDPRRDVRDMLVASNGRHGTLLARGAFHVNPSALEKAGNLRKTNYHGYNLYSTGEAGFCVLDGTLAIAGHIDEIEAALDAYKSGNHTPTEQLLAKAQAVPLKYQVWVVSQGAADFIARNLPPTGNAANFARIFHSLQDTLLEADFRAGFNAIVEGVTGTSEDAKSLGDAVRGIIGLGRLSVPQKQPELLKLWDAIHVEQQQNRITITADIPQELIDKLVQMFDTGRSDI